MANTISNTVGGNADDPNKAAQLLSHAVLGAVVAYNNGGSAAAGAVSGAGSEAAGDYLLKTLHPGKQKQDLNEQEKQQLLGLTNSVAAVAGGLAGNSAANVAISSTVVAANAVEHNALFNRSVDKDLTPDQQQIVKIARDAGVYDINDLRKEYIACKDDSCRKEKRQNHEMQTSANAKILYNLYKQGKLTKIQVEQLVGGSIAKKYAEAADKLERSKYFGYSPETKETFDWGSPAANGEVFKDIIHDWRESAGADKTATNAVDLITSIYNPNNAVQILDEINEEKRLPIFPKLPKLSPKTDLPKNTTNPNAQKIDNKEQLKTSTKPDVTAKPEVVGSQNIQKPEIGAKPNSTVKWQEKDGKVSVNSITDSIKNINSKSPNAQNALNKKFNALHDAEKKAVKTKVLPDGRIRYYEKERPAKKSGPTRGNSIVTEYTPKTGSVKQWMESYDQSGKVNRVHPKNIEGTQQNSLHFPPTGEELQQINK